MRYPIVILILVALFAMMPMEKAKKDEKRSETLVGYVLSEQEHASAKQWLDNGVKRLRELPPMHQVLLLTTFIILIINAAVVVAYIVNSIAAIANIGISILLFLPLVLLAVVWSKPRKALMKRLKAHAEFGPFVSKFSTRMWQRRFRRAAREHGFASQY